MMQADLLDLDAAVSRDRILDPGAVLLGGFATGPARLLLDAIAEIRTRSPFRHLETPGGRVMSVAMTNTGQVGWVSDRTGYRYDPIDPVTGLPWPAMPACFAELARAAAEAAGFRGFEPDACLVNRYVPGARLTLHQDKDERGLDAPIVSVSLGLPAIFLWGGQERRDRPVRVPVLHGDVVVWGGPARMTYHGVDTLKQGEHPLTGAARYNLTFRKAC